MASKLIEEGYIQSIACMHKNATPDGFSASPERHVNYYSVWARDHSITALAALLTKDEELIATAKKGLLHLLQHQSDAGQIPSYVEIEKKNKVYGGLGSITSIDSNLWVLICAEKIYAQTKDKRLLNKTNIFRYRQMYRLIRAFDSNNCGLMEVHIAGDWADIMHRSYHVLYDECLHLEAFKSLERMYKLFLAKPQTDLHKKIRTNLRYLKKRKALIKPIMNKMFWFTPESIPKIKEQYMIYYGDMEPFPFYQSHITPFEHEWSHRFDSFGNSLAILSGIANKDKAKQIISYANDLKMSEPHSMPALHPVIQPTDIDWEPIYELKEQPHVYHNGGIWPMTVGFWVAALVKAGKKKQAQAELEKLAKLLESQQWLFAEYFHGDSAVPMGRMNQAWSAAGFIIGYHAVKYGTMPF